MKTILCMLGLALTTPTWAQTTDVKGVPMDGDTTISISKGKKGQNEFEIVEGTADISGEPEVLTKAARTSWKQACDEWKKEQKELNKENPIIALSCNSPECSKNATSETVCHSKGTFKIKTRVR